MEERTALADKGQSNFHIGKRNLKGSFKSAAYNGLDIKRIQIWKKKNSNEILVVCRRDIIWVLGVFLVVFLIDFCLFVCLFFCLGFLFFSFFFLVCWLVGWLVWAFLGGLLSWILLENYLYQLLKKTPRFLFVPSNVCYVLRDKFVQQHREKN